MHMKSKIQKNCVCVNHLASTTNHGLAIFIASTVFITTLRSLLLAGTKFSDFTKSFNWRVVFFLLFLNHAIQFGVYLIFNEYDVIAKFAKISTR